MMSDRAEFGRRASKAGFTLVELLVVIAIISILAGLMLPVLGKAIRETRKISCINNLNQCGLLLLNYANDYNGYFATANGTRLTEDPYTDTTFQGASNFYNNSANRETSFGLGLLWKLDYMSSPAIMFCEDVKTGYHNPALGNNYWIYYHTYFYNGGLKKPAGSFKPSMKINAHTGAVLAYDRPLVFMHDGKFGVLHVDGSARSINWDNYPNSITASQLER